MITRIGRRVQTGRGFWAKANKICYTGPAPDRNVLCFDATGYETAGGGVRKARGKRPKRVKPLKLTRSGAGRWGVSTPRSPRTPRSPLSSSAGTPGSMTPPPDPTPPRKPYMQTSFKDNDWGIQGTPPSAHRWGTFWKNIGMTPVGNPQRPTPLSTIKKKKQRKRRQ